MSRPVMHQSVNLTICFSRSVCASLLLQVLFCRGTKFQTIHHECSEEEVGGVREEKEKFIVEEVEPSPFLVNM